MKIVEGSGCVEREGKRTMEVGRRRKAEDGRGPPEKPGQQRSTEGRKRQATTGEGQTAPACRDGNRTSQGRTPATKGSRRPVACSGKPTPEIAVWGAQAGRVGSQKTGSGVRPADGKAKRAAEGDPLGPGQENG